MDNTIVPENIHLLQVHWIKENPIINSVNEELSPSYNFQINYSMMHNLEKEIVKIGIFIDIAGEITNQNMQEQNGNYEIDFIFKIDQLDSNYQLIDAKPLFDGMFVGTLLSISYSTTRGMLLTSWRNSIMEKVILPVISVQELLKNKKTK
jgi:hypothetical protein